MIAAGSWAGQLDVDDGAAAAVRPVRGQLLRLQWRGAPLHHIVWGPDCYVVPWGDWTVLVGATVEDVGFDERTTAAGVRDLLDAVCELLPEAWRATFIEARVGLRPATPDGLPFIGASERSSRLVYATGHYRNGILLAPLTARLIADLIVDGREDAALAQLRPTRERPASPTRGAPVNCSARLKSRRNRGTAPDFERRLVGSALRRPVDLPQHGRAAPSAVPTFCTRSKVTAAS